MKERHIVFGVTGSIAAYKAAGICSRLTQQGVHVHVIMTRNACRLISPATFASLSKNPVYTRLFSMAREHPYPHISLSELADLVLVAPATANSIAKIALGIADDLLSTTVLACKAPVVVAPAMNVRMFENPALQENLAKLRSRGFHIVGPEEGSLADGSVGKGRMASPDEIFQVVCKLLE